MNAITELTRRSWMVVGNGPDTRIMECRPDKDNKEQLVTYEQAKAQASESLEDFVSPYLRRIEELQQDEFKERGKLPKFKAWHKRSTLVVAKSQKQAAELLRTSDYHIRTYFELANGDWWYRYADSESMSRARSETVFFSENRSR
jgi:hypothetical protein